MWMSHPARGAWIEIIVDTPLAAGSRWSHPARGAWIEMFNLLKSDNMLVVLSHPARGAWIEISGIENTDRTGKSHPARGAWIEI